MKPSLLLNGKTDKIVSIAITSAIITFLNQSPTPNKVLLALSPIAGILSPWMAFKLLNAYEWVECIVSMTAKSLSFKYSLRLSTRHIENAVRNKVKSEVIDLMKEKQNESYLAHSDQIIIESAKGSATRKGKKPPKETPATDRPNENRKEEQSELTIEKTVKIEIPHDGVS